MGWLAVPAVDARGPVAVFGGERPPAGQLAGAIPSRRLRVNHSASRVRGRTDAHVPFPQRLRRHQHGHGETAGAGRPGDRRLAWQPGLSRPRAERAP